MQIADEHIARLRMARIGRRAAVMEFVAASMRHREDSAVSDTAERPRQVAQPLDNEVDDLALSLDAAIQCIDKADRNAT